MQQEQVIHATCFYPDHHGVIRSGYRPITRTWSGLTRANSTSISPRTSNSAAIVGANGMKTTTIIARSCIYEIFTNSVLTLFSPYVECASLLTAPTKSEAAQPVP